MADKMPAQRPDPWFPAWPTGPGWLLLCLLPLLSACGGGGGRLAQGYAPGDRIYPEPGPPEDPWRPYIRQAAGRFSVPQQWIRAVMHQESGGHEYRNGQPIVSGAGAMGLMQLMPATYAELQAQYGLGSDPFEPHDNIMAGTGYIRQMYDRYGAPGFLAAYNAGPQRLDDYLGRGRRLPNETEDYVASIAPNLGTEIAMTGPLAVYAGGGTAYADARPIRAPVRLAAYHTRLPQGGCRQDPDAAYDPGAACSGVALAAAAPARQAIRIAPPTPGCADAAYDEACTDTPAVRQATYVVPPAASSALGPPRCAGNADVAYDAPCPATAPAIASAGPPGAVNRSYVQPAYAQPGYALPAYGPGSYAPPVRPAMATATAVGDWAIQVGAYASEAQARFANTMARQADFRALAGSRSLVQETQPSGHGVLYRARLAGLARGEAGAACSALQAQSIPCMVVGPGG